MNDTLAYPPRSLPGPLHATLLAGGVPLYLGALLSDVAYFKTYLIQWSNFAAWLLAAGVLFSGLALLFALVNLARAPYKRGRATGYFLLVLATAVVGLVDCFQHAKDAWAVMPLGLLLSLLAALLSCVAAWAGLTNLRSEATR